MNKTCGCCEGIEQLTPIAINNRPGLDVLVYRVGTHGSFLETMLARLSNLGIQRKDLGIPLSASDDPNERIYPLQGLTTRTASDPAIAFLDAWATVADVLTFYQERIANEGYLRTATERRSILELARLVGYTLRPGVAASVFLAYTLEKDHDVILSRGNRAQSVPDPGELPQSFETAEPLEARFIWNTLQPRLTRPQFIRLIPPPDTSTGDEHTVNTDNIYFQGTATKLKSGDPLLFIFTDPIMGHWFVSDDSYRSFAFVRVSSVESQAAQNRTRVTIARSPQPLPISSSMISGMSPAVSSPLSSPLGSPPGLPHEPPGTDITLGLGRLVDKLTAPPSLPPRNAQQLPRKVEQIFNVRSGTNALLLKALNPALRETLDAALSNTDVAPIASSIPTLDCVAALRVKAALFGHDVQISSTRTSTEITNVFLSRIAQIRRSSTSIEDLEKLLPLDAEYDQIIVGSWVVVESTDQTLEIVRTFHRVTKVQTISLSPLDLLLGFQKGSVLSSPTVSAATPPDPSIAALAIAKKITLLTVDPAWLPRTDKDNLLTILRTTTIYAQSECLPLSEVPFTTTAQPPAAGFPSQEEVCVIQGDQIELDRLYPDLKSGQRLIVSGERADIEGTSGVRVSEQVMLAGITQDVSRVQVDGLQVPLPGDKLHTFLQLATSLSFKYKCDTVTIYGNVVRATHGETRTETLGSGDGSKALQRFTLRQSPLTYLAAPTPVGAESTLKVSVNDILWQEAVSLADLGPTDRNYTTETDDTDKTTVIFGNGQYGARLPTGVENVKAVYRTGIGKAGNVKAGQITLLATKPLGVKSVVNPQRASGGADRESSNSARRNVPLALLALDRLVSVEDYQDFARTYAGIGKASAARLSNGRRQLVHLSIVGVDNIPIDRNSDLYLNLVQALQQFGDPNLPLQVDICAVMFIIISAGVRLLANYQWESVESNIRATLLDTFSFERREPGQAVFESEVFSAIQGIAGVDYVELRVLGAVDQNAIVAAADKKPPPDPGQFLAELGLNDHKNIPVQLASLDTSTGTIDAAQLAFLSPDVPDTLILTELPQ